MSWAAELGLWLVRLIAAALIVLTALSGLRTGKWYVRLWDFPRAQITALGGVVGVVLVGGVATGWGALADVALVVVLGAALAWQLTHIVPYTRLWPKAIRKADASDARLMIANLDYTNTSHAQIRALIEEEDADLVLLIEVDRRWMDALASVREAYPHRLEAVRPEGLGLTLWSRIPIEGEEVRELVSDQRVSLWTDLVLGDGRRRVRFVGVHPTPPALHKEGSDERYDSRIRDAELLGIAREAAEEQGVVWVVAGDFNDVAWSHTTRLFRDLSGLRDPRIGRRLLNTFPSAIPFLRYPLDHIFVSPTVRVSGLDRVFVPGSDHFGLLVDLQFPDAQGEQRPDADAGEREEARDIEEEGLQDARRSGELAAGTDIGPAPAERGARPGPIARAR